MSAEELAAMAALNAEMEAAATKLCNTAVVVIEVGNASLVDKIKRGCTVTAVNGVSVDGQPYAQVMKTVRLELQPYRHTGALSMLFCR